MSLYTLKLRFFFVCVHEAYFYLSSKNNERVVVFWYMLCRNLNNKHENVFFSFKITLIFCLVKETPSEKYTHILKKKTSKASYLIRVQTGFRKNSFNKKYIRIFNYPVYINKFVLFIFSTSIVAHKKTNVILIPDLLHTTFILKLQLTFLSLVVHFIVFSIYSYTFNVR